MSNRLTQSRLEGGGITAINAIFFDFSSIPVELFILEENFCLLKFRSHRDASFPPFGRSLR